MSLTDGKQLTVIFTSGLYQIPPFQRDYSWKKPQIEDFWNDAIDIFDSNDSNYFFGPVVFIKNNQQEYASVVDGQQRLTTIQILICVIRDIINSNGSEKHATQLENFLYPPTDVDKIIPTLQLNENNNPFFKKFILKRTDPGKNFDVKKKIDDNKTTIPTEKLLYENYKRLYKMVKDRFLKSGQKKQEVNETLYRFITSMLESFRVFEIVLDNEDRAFRLFATLNQRGLALSTSDLVKNYIFMKSGVAQRHEFHEIWKKIVGNLDDKNELDDFLRHAWIAKYNYVTSQSLYKAITDKIQKPNEVNDYLENLLSDSSTYTKFVHTNSEDDTGYYLKSLFHDLKNDSAQSVILNAYKFWKENPKDIDNIIKICLDMFFRGKTIGGKAPGVVGKTFAKAAELIRTSKNFNEVSDELKRIDISNKEFKNSIGDKDHQVNIAKYILKNYERNFLNTDRISKTIVDSITLEHIMPQSLTYTKGMSKEKIKTDWLNPESKSYVSEIDHPRYLNRIGNLTLLHKLTNSELQNMSFEEKKSKYETESQLDITMELANADFWNVESIESRSEIISDFVNEIWKTLLNDAETKKIDEEEIEY